MTNQADNRNNAIIDERDIRNLWRIIRKNWYIFAFFLIASVSLAFFYIHKSTTVHAASIKILLSANQSYDIKDAILQGLGIDPVYENINNEMQVVASHPIVKDAVERMDMEVAYYVIGRVKNTEIYKGSPFEADIRITNSSYYDKPIYINVLNAREFELTIERSEKNYKKRHYFDQPLTTDNFFMILKPNKKLLNSLFSKAEHPEEVNYMIRVYQPGHLISKYKNSLTVKKFDWPAAYIQVIVEDEISQRGKDFLDTLSQVYIENSVKEIKMINDNALHFIDEQLAEVVSNINFIESNLEQYREDNELTFDIDVEQKVMLDRLVKLETERTELEMRLKSIEFLDKLMALNNNSMNIATSTIQNQRDPYLSEALRELNILLNRRNLMSFNHKENSPALKEVDQQIHHLKSNIAEFINNTGKSLQDKVKVLDEQIAKYEKIVKKIPQTERQFVNIKRRLDINEKIYIYLLEKKAETIIAKAGIVPDKNILEPAIPLGIVRPNKQKVMFTFAGAGLILAFSLVFIRMFFFDTIDSKEDLEQQSDLPVLGLIRKSNANIYQVINKNPKSIVAEGFRGIRANLDYLPSEENSKVILITSCVSGEGKTFNSVNLASVLAKANKKVLLIELDLHKPKMGRAMNMENDTGMSKYLSGTATLDKLAKPTDDKNLSVILSGPVPPNASDLIVRPRTEQLIKNMREEYDYIIIDTPPVGLVADAIHLMKFSDVNLFVLKARKATKSFVKTAHEIQQKHQPGNFGFILNGVSEKGRFGYSYGYGHGYGYGSGKKEGYLSEKG